MSVQRAQWRFICGLKCEWDASEPWKEGFVQSPQTLLRKSKRSRLTKNRYVVQENFGSFRKKLH